MTLTPALELIGRELEIALRRRTAARNRRVRTARLVATAATLAVAFSAAALASGIVGDLHLDPAKWAILGGGTVDGGRGEYVHAQRLADGSSSTFLVEHDAGLPPYQAFLLHEKAVAAAQAGHEQGELCTPAALTRAESVALTTLRAGFAPGTDAGTTKSAVGSAVASAFAGAPCKGLEYAGEQARRVFAGIQPISTLMPGVR